MVRNHPPLPHSPPPPSYCHRAGVTLRARRAKKELEGYSIPEDEVQLLGYRWTAYEEFLDYEELYYTHWSQ